MKSVFALWVLFGIVFTICLVGFRRAKQLLNQERFEKMRNTVLTIAFGLIALGIVLYAIFYR